MFKTFSSLVSRLFAGKNKKDIFSVLAAWVFILILGVGFWPGKDYLKIKAFLATWKKPAPAEFSGDPTPNSPLGAPYTFPSGIQTYRFSHGKDVVGPKIKTAIIDPLDPQPGATQTITLEIESVSPVKSAVIIAATDNRKETLSLKLISGDFLEGAYQVSWQVKDTYNVRYFFRYILTAEDSVFDNIMYLR